VNPGDTIRIRNSATPYDGQALLTRSGTNDTTGRITIEPDVGHTPILRNLSSDAYAGAITLQKVSYVTVQNLTFDGTAAGGSLSKHAILLQATLNSSNGADMVNIWILNNTITNWAVSAAVANNFGHRAAISLDGGFCEPTPCPGIVTGAHVAGNTITGARQLGIVVLHGRNTLIENNTISGMKWGVEAPGQITATAIKIGDSHAAPGTGGHVVRNNTLHSSVPRASTDLSASGAYVNSGFWCDVNVSNSTIEANHIYNIDPTHQTDANGEAAGIFIEAGCFGWRVRNNLIHDVGSQGLSSRTGEASGFNCIPRSQWQNNPTYWQNNTVYNSWRGMNMLAGYHRIENNIFAGITGVYYRIYCGDNVAQVINYNLYETTSGNKFLWNAVSQSATTYTNWKAAGNCNCDANSVVGNPLFVNTTPGQEDFHLQAASPARGAGVGGVDLGADPSQGAPQPSPPLNLRIISIQ
jgi:parallel beta-helix repeat protein